MANNTTNITRMFLNNSTSFPNILNGRPECYTAVAWRVYLTKAQTQALAICYGTTVLPAVLLNSLLCFCLYKDGRWKNQSKFLIFVLNISDALMGFLSIPGSIFLCSVLSHRRNCFVERIIVFFGQTNGHFSFYITLAIATQRFVKMRWQLLEKYQFIKRSFSRTGLRAITVSVFLLSSVHGVVSTYFFGLVNTSIPNIAMMLLRAVILIAIQFCYYRVYVTVKTHVKTNLTRKKESTTSVQSHERKNALFSKVNRTVLIVMILLAVSFLPACIADIWTGYYTLIKGTTAPMLPRFIFYLSFTAIFFNCSLNAAVIIFQDWASISRVYTARG